MSKAQIKIAALTLIAFAAWCALVFAVRAEPVDPWPAYTALLDSVLAHKHLHVVKHKPFKRHR